MTTPREKLERRKQTFTEYVDSGEINEQTGEAVLELVNAFDNNTMYPPPENEGSREPSTLMSWLWPLMTMARERNLVDADANGLKRDLQAMKDGDTPRLSSPVGHASGRPRQRQRDSARGPSS